MSKDFVATYAASERQAEERLDAEVERHIEVLQRLKTKVGERETVRQRKERYHEQAAQLKEEKKRLGQGKPTSKRQQDLGEVNDGSRRQAKSTLSTVINSLDKLVELERRITGLENDRFGSGFPYTFFFLQITKCACGVCYFLQVVKSLTKGVCIF